MIPSGSTQQTCVRARVLITHTPHSSVCLKISLHNILIHAHCINSLINISFKSMKMKNIYLFNNEQ